MSLVTSGERYSRSLNAHLSWLLLGAAALGCADLDPGADTCMTSDQCLQSTKQSLGPPLYERDPMRWGCLAPDYKPPVLPPPQATDVFNYTAILADFATFNPLGPADGAKISFCLNQADTCPQPTMAVPVPVAPGIFAYNLQIRGGVEGFLRQEAMGHTIQDYYLLAPMTQDSMTLRTTQRDAFTLVSTDSFAGFVRDVAINVDPELAIMGLEIRDCRGDRVAGAKLNLPDRGTILSLQSADYYATDHRLPVIDSVTDADGIAGWVNLPVGTVQVEAVLDSYTFGLTRLRVQGGRITGGVIRPRYDTGM